MWVRWVPVSKDDGFGVDIRWRAVYDPDEADATIDSVVQVMKELGLEPWGGDGSGAGDGGACGGDGSGGGYGGGGGSSNGGGGGSASFGGGNASILGSASGGGGGLDSTWQTVSARASDLDST